MRFLLVLLLVLIPISYAADLKYVTIGEPVDVFVYSQKYTLDITRLTRSSVTFEIQPGSVSALIFVNETKEIRLPGNKYLILKPTRIQTNTTYVEVSTREDTPYQPPQQTHNQNTNYQDNQNYQEQNNPETPNNTDVVEEAEENTIKNNNLYFILGGIFMVFLIFGGVSYFILRKNKTVDVTIGVPVKEPVVSKITSFDEYESLRKNLEKKF